MSLKVPFVFEVYLFKNVGQEFFLLQYFVALWLVPEILVSDAQIIDRFPDVA